MNAILENIMTRRSCRAFEKRRIPDADLEQILTAAVYAPTAMNRQTWRFTVLRDADRIAQLARAVGAAIGREGYDFYQPDTLVIVSNVRTNANAIADAGCAMQNIMLMAHSLGVASCWINQMKDTNGDPAVRALLESLLDRSTLLCAAAASQCISNVPAAILLSGFTGDWQGLLAGVNIGGLGTPVASLASLISLRLYLKEPGARARRFLSVFTLVNVAGLALLLGVAALLF